VGHEHASHEAVAGLLARQGVAETIHRYCWAYDARDLPALAALVTDEVVVDSGGRHEGAAAALEFWQRSWDHVQASRHHVTNLVIDLAPNGPGASARSYFSSLSVVDGSPRLVLGRYHDRLVAEDGRWRFTEKVHHIDSLGPFAEGFQPREVQRPWS
jgi:ketosteroid isomerase-like protein